ncbi:NADH-quinone oxidoreductase subunit L [Azohydromonas aeria]|uniref:NADH-quinone oxidoreductase subunit L n=1 Tax=Azohydromonas aeria TaxID=2590212 RepID=UPI0012FA9CAD|nr:NADH-quinone oxidoreductase subunit L [Azohydromonas aeria]
MTTASTEVVSLAGWHVLLVLLPALAAALGALALAAGRRTVSPQAAWRVAQGSLLAALVGAVLALGALALHGGGTGWGLRADLPGVLVALLVCCVGAVIVRFCPAYLAGERGETGAARRLLAVLAAALVVAVADHLLLLALAWAGCGLAMQGLLGFYAERPAARRAAAKHFVMARAADLCMAGALLLLALSPGGWRIGELQAWAAQSGTLPGEVQAAVVLVALAAVLRCALMPFHGWLIQVMEAPTPVSALLHAGVVNLGGLVLIRLAPLVEQTLAAQALLVAAGTLTAVLAALVMSTRVSIKVALAWSTCAQMGFMLLQCGLGLWPLALLHLVAHSLYKAHAFLRTGSVVQAVQLRRLGPADAPASPARLFMGAALGLGLAAAAGWVAGMDAGSPPAQWVMAGILALALTPLLQPQAAQGWRWAVSALGALALAIAGFGLHHLLGAWMPSGAPAAAPLWAGVALAMAGLFALQCVLAAWPRGALARRLYPWCWGGLFLDEALSRWLWPARAARIAPPRPRPVRALKPATTTGGR